MRLVWQLQTPQCRCQAKKAEEFAGNRGRQGARVGGQGASNAHGHLTSAHHPATACGDFNLSTLRGEVEGPQRCAKLQAGSTFLRADSEKISTNAWISKLNYPQLEIPNQMGISNGKVFKKWLGFTQ